MAAVPSAAELIANVRELTSTNGTFQTAWSNSFTSPHHCREEGGFIYVDFPVLRPLTRAYVVRAPSGATMNQRTQGPNASIDLNRPGIRKNSVILAANFHTHPLSAQVGGDPQPSRADIANASARGVPGIVVSRNGLYSYGPERRENVQNPKGYPGRVEGLFNPTLAKAQPPPTTVRNQWPEGTGLIASQSTYNSEGDLVTLAPSSRDSEVDDGARDGLGVVYAEWSDKGIEYGPPLVEDEENDVHQAGREKTKILESSEFHV